MNSRLAFRTSACAGITLAVVAIGAASLPAQVRVPKDHVDASWPKPLPERWGLGGLGGVCVGRPRPRAAAESAGRPRQAT